MSASSDSLRSMYAALQAEPKPVTLQTLMRLERRVQDVKELASKLPRARDGGAADAEYRKAEEAIEWHCRKVYLSAPVQRHAEQVLTEPTDDKDLLEVAQRVLRASGRRQPR